MRRLIYLLKQRFRFEHLPARLLYTHPLQSRCLLYCCSDRTMGVRHSLSHLPFSVRFTDGLNHDFQAFRNRLHHSLHLLPNNAPFRQTRQRPLLQN